MGGGGGGHDLCPLRCSTLSRPRTGRSLPGGRSADEGVGYRAKSLVFFFLFIVGRIIFFLPQLDGEALEDDLIIILG